MYCVEDGMRKWRWLLLLSFELLRVLTLNKPIVNCVSHGTWSLPAGYRLFRFSVLSALALTLATLEVSFVAGKTPFASVLLIPLL